MSNQKIDIANEVIEKYKELGDQEDFYEQVQDIVELFDEGFATGVFVALQVIRQKAHNANSETARELVCAIGGTGFLRNHLEPDNEVDAETIEWLDSIIFSD